MYPDQNLIITVFADVPTPDVRLSAETRSNTKRSLYQSVLDYLWFYIWFPQWNHVMWMADNTQRNLPVLIYMQSSYPLHLPAYDATAYITTKHANIQLYSRWTLFLDFGPRFELWKNDVNDTMKSCYDMISKLCRIITTDHYCAICNQNYIGSWCNGTWAPYIKTVFPRYGDSDVKDKSVGRPSYH